jgi:hypothetical protein
MQNSAHSNYQSSLKMALQKMHAGNKCVQQTNDQQATQKDNTGNRAVRDNLQQKGGKMRKCFPGLAEMCTTNRES